MKKLREAVPGAPGQVRVLYRDASIHEDVFEHGTDWVDVDESSDFAVTLKLDGLIPNHHYRIAVQTRKEEGAVEFGDTKKGFFWTAPLDDNSSERVVFTVIGNHPSGYDRKKRLHDVEGGINIYSNDVMRSVEGLKFAIHAGHYVYYDKDEAKNIALARYIWERMSSQRLLRSFQQDVPMYFVRGDRDTWSNDAYPGKEVEEYFEFTFEDGLEIWREQTPILENEGTSYRTFRWGKHVQIWLMEGREFRSANDAMDGQDKTIWGQTQINWLQSTVAQSDATFKFLVSSSPLVGPDKCCDKADNHANEAFEFEGNIVRNFVKDNNMFVLCGDRNWQYASVDPITEVREYSPGAAVDWKAAVEDGKIEYDPNYHKYFALVGGFLSVEVEEESGVPMLTISFRDTDGNIYYREVFDPQGPV